MKPDFSGVTHKMHHSCFTNSIQGSVPACGASFEGQPLAVMLTKVNVIWVQGHSSGQLMRYTVKYYYFFHYNKSKGPPRCLDRKMVIYNREKRETVKTECNTMESVKTRNYWRGYVKLRCRPAKTHQSLSSQTLAAIKKIS